jgi:hypothetical protein
MIAVMRRFIISLLACAAPAAGHAADRNALESKVIVDAGWFFVSTDMRVRVDGETSDTVGSDVDFEDTFGIGDFDRFRIEGSWRFASRHLIRGMYFESNRGASRSLQRDVVFRDETFPLGLTVAARSELAIAQLSYEYAFLKRDNYELAAGIGVHYFEIGLGLDATLSGLGGSASRSLDAEATTQAPLPVLGLRALWQLPHDFYITAQVQYFSLDFEEYSGSLLDLKASFVWQLSDHVGIGVAYNDFGFSFDIEDRGDFDGRLRWDYGGAIAFATVMF